MSILFLFSSLLLLHPFSCQDEGNKDRGVLIEENTFPSGLLTKDSFIRKDNGTSEGYYLHPVPVRRRQRKRLRVQKASDEIISPDLLKPGQVKPSQETSTSQGSQNPQQYIDVTPRGNHRQVYRNNNNVSRQHTEKSRHHRQHLESEGYDGRYFYISLDCGATAMTITARSPDPFRGRIFIKDHGQKPECQMTGGDEFAGSLTISYNNPNCGIVDLGNGTLMTKVVIQRHSQIMMKDDVSYKLLCSFDTKDTIVTNSIAVEGEVYTSWIAETAPTPGVRLRIIDMKGNDVTSAKIGDELFLLVEILDERLFGIFVTDLVAISGTNSNSITLLDHDGCATEPSVFPLIKRTPESKDLKGKFGAFRFADDSIVKFQVTVKFCLEECKPVKCVDNGKLGYGRKKRELTDTTTDGHLPEEIPLQLAIVVDSHESHLPDESPDDVDVHGLRETDVCFTRVHLILCAITTVALQLFTIIICLICVRNLRRRHLLNCKASQESLSTCANSNVTLVHKLPCNRKSTS
ncbi:uncharacterized protein LOC143240691 [Tachypleus tridentatus]|uniref:uncharacterized protein LOC143240691 n=1 Tax=Tachypleus tridentatus TaxID=6853 RepID=UPI003FD654CA